MERTRAAISARKISSKAGRMTRTITATRRLPHPYFTKRAGAGAKLFPRCREESSAYSFVDVGAGKGRALLLAAELPFRKVVGVEVSEELARIAQRNVARWSRVAKPKAKIRVVHEDAAKFRWPRTPLLVYLYNPFACSLVAQMAERLAAAAATGSGLVDLLYVNPTCADTLTTQGLFVRLWTARIPMDEADQKADPYGTTSDLVSGYRLK